MNEWFTSDWITLISSIIGVMIIVYGFTTGKAKEWLKWAVTVTESELGTGTGQLKLRQVYNMFIAKFPVFSKLVPFSVFSTWVDVALDWLEDQLNKNERISDFVQGTYHF